MVFTRVLAAGIILCLSHAWGQSIAGSLIPTFDPGAGANGQVRAVFYQPDGKVVIAGAFSQVQGTPRSGVARLNADGSLDLSFDPGDGANNVVNALLVRGNGQIFVGGDFNSFNGSEHNGLVLLNADGSIDESFNSLLFKSSAASNPPGFITSIAAAADGEIVVGGSFDRADDALASGVARLGRDGTLDIIYQPNAGPNGKVNAVVVLPSGQILIGGEFTSVDNAPRNGVARLNVDGQLDTTFLPGTGATGGAVLALTPQADGAVILAGNFSQVAGQSHVGLARLLPNGGLDLSFSPALDGSVYSVALQSDGKLLIGGAFGTVNGVARSGLARLNTDGSLDLGFDPGSGVNSPVLALALTANDTALIAGAFTMVNETPLAGLAEISASALSVPLVTVTADVSVIGRDLGNLATITIHRTGDISQDLKVNYAVVGKAVSGVDYVPVKGARKIKAGKAKGAFKIQWLGSGDVSGSVNAKVKLLPGDGYTVIDPALLKVKINR